MSQAAAVPLYEPEMCPQETVCPYLDSYKVVYVEHCPHNRVPNWEEGRERLRACVTHLRLCECVFFTIGLQTFNTQK